MVFPTFQNKHLNYLNTLKRPVIEGSKLLQVLGECRCKMSSTFAIVASVVWIRAMNGNCKRKNSADNIPK